MSILPSEVLARARRCCAIWQDSQWTTAADASSGRCWTGTSRPSISMSRWARAPNRSGPPTGWPARRCWIWQRIERLRLLKNKRPGFWPGRLHSDLYRSHRLVAEVFFFHLLDGMLATLLRATGEVPRREGEHRHHQQDQAGHRVDLRLHTQAHGGKDLHRQGG